MFKKLVLIAVFVFLVCGLVYSEEVCIVERNNVISRVENRTFPSVFGAWHHSIINHDRPDDIWEWGYTKEMYSYHDLFWSGLFRGLHWNIDHSQIVTVDGGTQYDIGLINELHEINPNFLYIASLNHYGVSGDHYPDDWEYWLRDENGNRLTDAGWSHIYLIDYTLPGAIDHFAKRAKAIADCGLHDGIFMDWWSEELVFDVGSDLVAKYYHGDRTDAIVELVKRIREYVGDDFLIIVNTNTRKIPRSAPYVNGAFMEVTSGIDGYTHEELIGIEHALSWYETNLRYPQVNCLEGWGMPTESLNAPNNYQQARAIIALGLTHSDGYVSFVPGIISPTHNHQYEIWEGHTHEHELGVPHGHTHEKYWYDFYDVDLGEPIGAKSQLYDNREGLFIREFARGWVVYNRSGSEQEIRFGSHVSGKASGFGGTKHIIPDLDGEIYLKDNRLDINADGDVNILDLVLTANSLGEPGGQADVNADGVVNILDLVLIANAFN